MTDDHEDGRSFSGVKKEANKGSVSKLETYILSFVTSCQLVTMS